MREMVTPERLLLPMPSIPMPGDVVTWYQEARPNTGTLLGHNCEGKPVVRVGTKERLIPDATVKSYYAMRLNDYKNKVPPNWNRLPQTGCILSALPEEVSKFGEILSQQIPPGPKYYEFISEIWQRGFEVYLVGGTVRDVISGQNSFDVDLVTTIPLHILRPLIQSMFRNDPGGSNKNGYIRIGGTPDSGDPFIDVKVFCLYRPGTTGAMFGSDFTADIAHRDFCCNAIYYDPVNKVFVDPSGRGVRDAESLKLNLVHDPIIGNSRYHNGTIAIRFFKFLTRKFTYEDATRELILENYLPSLAAMEKSRRVNYLRTQLLSKYPIHMHDSLFDEFGKCMCEFGANEHWEKYVEPFKQEVMSYE